MKIIPKRSFSDLKSKDDKITSISTKTTEPEIMTEFEFVAEKATKYYKEVCDDESLLYPDIKDMYYSKKLGLEDDSYIPKSERLLAIYDMLTNKSFPRKGKGKSTKPKILDAIVMAATDLKLKLQGAYDV